MPTTKCLLVTDDPDDHQAITDALAELAEDVVVLVVLDSQKALSFLLEKSAAINYIIVDLSMHGIRINSFLKALAADKELKEVAIAAYGYDEQLAAIGEYENVRVFNKEYDYSTLKIFLLEMTHK